MNIIKPVNEYNKQGWANCHRTVQLPVPVSYRTSYLPNWQHVRNQAKSAFHRIIPFHTMVAVGTHSLTQHIDTVGLQVLDRNQKALTFNGLKYHLIPQKNKK